MSRIGAKAVKILDGVDVRVDGNQVFAKHSNGELSTSIPEGITVKVEDGNIIVHTESDDRQVKAFWGMTRSFIENMINGVANKFVIELEIQGVGYKANLQGKTLVLALGFSHDVKFDVPEGIEIKCPKPTEIIISGIDKQQVGQTAAKIRGYKPPEPYKGKGIRYSNKYGKGGEYVRRKEGKKK